jgi:hypothetical protein
MEIGNQFIGWSLLITSGLLTIWRKKKLFDIQRHPSYWKHLFEKSMDGFCGFLALVSMIGGCDIGGARFSRFLGWFSFIACLWVSVIFHDRQLV